MPAIKYQFPNGDEVELYKPAGTAEENRELQTAFSLKIKALKRTGANLFGKVLGCKKK